jgi:hypothetical protein
MISIYGQNERILDHCLYRSSFQLLGASLRIIIYVYEPFLYS